jgi:hypothetical protein
MQERRKEICKAGAAIVALFAWLWIMLCVVGFLSE